VVYEAMWDTYRDGTRSSRELVRRHGITQRTAMRAISAGWPTRGFAPLRDRAREHDHQKVEMERKAAHDAFKEKTDAWYRAGKQYNRIADNAAAFITATLQAISNLAMVRAEDGRVQLRPLTKWVRKRDVQVVDGKRVIRTYDEEVPLTIAEGVKLQAQVLKGAAMASAFKRLWPLTTDEERAKDEPEGLAALSVEQLQHIVETGQLPPGVSSEDVFGVTIPGMGGKPGRKANN
jgi:hypothetical protein